MKASFKGGFTLIETLVAIMMLGAFVAGAARLIAMARESTDMARDHYTAVNLARSRIERMRVFNFAQLPAFAITNAQINNVGESEPEGFFRLTTSISNVTTNLAFVSVRIDLLDRESRQFGKERQVLNTYIADFK